MVYRGWQDCLLNNIRLWFDWAIYDNIPNDNSGMFSLNNYYCKWLFGDYWGVCWGKWCGAFGEVVECWDPSDDAWLIFNVIIRSL